MKLLILLVFYAPLCVAAIMSIGFSIPIFCAGRFKEGIILFLIGGALWYISKKIFP